MEFKKKDFDYETNYGYERILVIEPSISNSPGTKTIVNVSVGLHNNECKECHRGATHQTNGYQMNKAEVKAMILELERLLK